MRPLRPACGTVSNAQLLTLPEIIRIIAPGVVTTQLSSLPPASRSATDVLGSSDSRLATAQPPEPAPTTTKSNVSATLGPPVSALSFPGSADGMSRLSVGRGWAIVELLARVPVFDRFSPDPAVINPQKSRRGPFQSGSALVHTARALGLWPGVAFSGSLLGTGSIGTFRGASSKPFSSRFSYRRAILYRGVEQPGSSSGS